MMVNEIYQATRQKMTQTLENLKTELSHVRTGKAAPALLESVRVNYYGTMMPITQIANVSAPEPRLLVVQPWDKKFLGEIERAILKSDLGLNPANDGHLIRISIPSLSEERRRELVKFVKKMGEENKIALRNIRRDSNEKLKNAEKDSEISEDELHREQEKIQELTDENVKKIDELLTRKEKEIMEF